MIKTAPSIGRVAALVTFALSCFSILLWLWISFGGSVPLGAQGYRVEVAFDEAVQLTSPVDVRAAGITIGTVRDTRLDERAGRTVATLELDPQYAPLSSDARATLRPKTLLGETFVEITRGTREAPALRDGGRLPDSQVAETVELDEVVTTYDARTRAAFRAWQRELAVAVGERGEDLNHALGHLPEFANASSDLLGVLDRHERALRGLVRDTGEVYGALTRDEGQLRRLVTGSRELFRQTAGEREALAETFQILPTFLEESRATSTRLESFARAAHPLVRDLRPGMRELGPTSRALRGLAPELTGFFRALDRQIDDSDEALPALREILRGTRPMLGTLGPFLGELNPIFEWLEAHQLLVSDFLGNAASGLADTTETANKGEVGHYLRQAGVSGLESLALHRRRLSTNRGNTYLPPVVLTEHGLDFGIFPNWDCKPSGGETRARHGTGGFPACALVPTPSFKGVEQGRFSHVEAADYSRER